jgi:Tol biopolymer transport system component
MSDVAISASFPRYREYDPLVPVWCVTPHTPRTIHRYFDSSPFSPSGRYLVSTQLPSEEHLPKPGDIAKIFVTDLTTGEERFVAETKGWDTQVGAHAHWGTDDRQLLFNDVDAATWMAHGVRLDLGTGQRTKFHGPIYSVSRDRRFAITPCLARTGIVQAGYGVIVPREFTRQSHELPDNDGIFLTDLASGEHRLLISIRELVRSMRGPCGQPDGKSGEFVGFHLTMNPQADRILFILRWMRKAPPAGKVFLNLWRQFSRAGRKIGRFLGQEWVLQAFQMPQMVLNTLFVLHTDGSHPKVILPADVYAQGGHHPNWCPDGRSVLMNRRIDGKMRFARFHLEDDRWEVLSDRIVGSGHPTLHSGGRHIVTDAYHFESVAFGDGTAPIRLVDLATETERTLVRIRTRPKIEGANLEFRVDPHPAWNQSFTRLAFNAYSKGTRNVYVADVSGLNLLTAS